MKHWLSIIGLMLMTHTAYTKEEHRQHDAHEHGHAKLNLVQEGSNIQILFETPAANIVGFEHEPKNAKEKKKVKEAIKLLKQGDKLFNFSSAAQCKLKDADVEGALVAEAHHDEHKHDEHEHHEDKHDKHHDEHHEDKHEHHEEEVHSEFEVTYVFKCKKVAALTDLSVNIFKYFPNTEEIDSQLVTEKKQFAAELSMKNATIRF